ncbi:MAG: DoxX family membrane protein, partial [Chitinophagaceae bacterium]|nr:DoxX family membrane protein [Chitinophagaceae bacterium]
MKLLINIVRVVVGLLFIFSGLIKANDPLGLSYKMQEFFELWGMEQFNSHTLWLSVVMIAFEIIAGIALALALPAQPLAAKPAPSSPAVDEVSAADLLDQLKSGKTT